MSIREAPLEDIRIRMNNYERCGDFSPHLFFLINVKKFGNFRFFDYLCTINIYIDMGYYYKAGRSWKDVKLWEATQDNPQEDINVESCLNQDNGWNIGSFLELAKEMQSVLKADYSYPIILDEEYKLVDGAHCLVHAYLDGKTTIKGVIIKNEQWPEPDYDENKECQNRQKPSNEHKRFEYQYENDISEFLKNKKANIKKLVEASKERKSSYVYDQDFMYVVNKRTCTITAWYMGLERNFERWTLSFSPKILKVIEKEIEDKL